MVRKKSHKTKHSRQKNALYPEKLGNYSRLSLDGNIFPLESEGRQRSAECPVPCFALEIEIRSGQ